jgi:hypothetical protein
MQDFGSTQPSAGPQLQRFRRERAIVVRPTKVIERIKLHPRDHHSDVLILYGRARLLGCISWIFSFLVFICCIVILVATRWGRPTTPAIMRRNQDSPGSCSSCPLPLHPQCLYRGSQSQLLEQKDRRPLHHHHCGSHLMLLTERELETLCPTFMAPMTTISSTLHFNGGGATTTATTVAGRVVVSAQI